MWLVWTEKKVGQRQSCKALQSKKDPLQETEMPVNLDENRETNVLETKWWKSVKEEWSTVLKWCWQANERRLEE